MSIDAHRQAEALMAEAGRLEVDGRLAEARSLYLQAAQHETDAQRLIPEARAKTRGIIAVSAVALYRRATAFEEAIQHAEQYLTQPGLPDFAREQLRELLADVRAEMNGRAQDRPIRTASG